MRNSILTLTIAIISIACAATAFADVKVKSKQTMGGQSYESTTYIKGKRQRSETLGGMVTITQCDLRRGVQLNTNSKTYMVNPFAPTTQTTTKTTAVTDKNGVIRTGGRVTTTVTIKDTGERKQMFGYTARHLIITMETVSSPDACTRSNTKMQTDGWYIDAAFALDCDNGAAYQSYTNNRAGGCQDKYDMKTVGTAKRGYPVYERMTMFDESGRESYSMVSEVIEFSQATLDASLFDIPAEFREVSDAAQMYSTYNQSSSVTKGSGSPNSGSQNDQSESGVASSIRNAAKSQVAPPLAAKKAGVIRIGLSAVKTGAVGDGITAADLSAAVQDTFAQVLRIQNIEVVTLESGPDSATETEARSKEFDYIIYANVSHKKGGGGFGMFKSLAPVLSSIAFSTSGNSAGTAPSATTVSGRVKNKDEITLDVRLNKIGGTSAFAKTYKAKAKSDGDDIISQIVEQSAQAIAAAIRQGGL